MILLRLSVSLDVDSFYRASLLSAARNKRDPYLLQSLLPQQTFNLINVKYFVRLMRNFRKTGDRSLFRNNSRLQMVEFRSRIFSILLDFCFDFVLFIPFRASLISSRLRPRYLARPVIFRSPITSAEVVDMTPISLLVSSRFQKKKEREREREREREKCAFFDFAKRRRTTKCLPRKCT